MSKDLISELLSLEAFAEELRQRCYRVRKRLEGVHSPASPKRGKKALPESEIHNLLANRKKTILKQTK